MRSHDSSRQWISELVEEYGECEEQGAQQKSRRGTEVKSLRDLHDVGYGVHRSQVFTYRYLTWIKGVKAAITTE